MMIRTLFRCRGVYRRQHVLLPRCHASSASSSPVPSSSLSRFSTCSIRRQLQSLQPQPHPQAETEAKNGNQNGNKTTAQSQLSPSSGLKSSRAPTSTSSLSSSSPSPSSTIAIDLPTTTNSSSKTTKHFSALFLRDSCTCPLCVHPSSRQKLFQTCDVPGDICGEIVPTEAVTSKEGSGKEKEKGKEKERDGEEEVFEIAWKNDVEGYLVGHRTRVEAGWLRGVVEVEEGLLGGYTSAISSDLAASSSSTSSSTSTSPSSASSPASSASSSTPWNRVLWNRSTIQDQNKRVDYADYMTNDATLLDSLRHLSRFGLLFLRNIPADPATEETAVERIAGRIGPLRDTFYGRTWDVRSVVGARNIAYTHQFLGLHMDLLYMTNPPHLQLLHSLRARSKGGASLFSDSFYAASVMAQEAPELFQSLCSFPVTYHYHNDSQHYHYTRPTIELYPTPHHQQQQQQASTIPSVPDPSRIKNINWSPPFQAPFETHITSSSSSPSSSSSLSTYRAAAALFNTLISAGENMLEYRLEEGECVVFDNRRVLHARRAFDVESGERWLKGAYVDDDVFFSRVRVLREARGVESGGDGKWEAGGVVRGGV